MKTLLIFFDIHTTVNLTFAGNLATIGYLKSLIYYYEQFYNTNNSYKMFKISLNQDLSILCCGNKRYSKLI